MYKIAFRLACEESESEVYENGKLKIFATKEDARNWALENLKSKFLISWSAVKI